jgi:parallel beta-helix repeat protein
VTKSHRFAGQPLLLLIALTVAAGCGGTRVAVQAGAPQASVSAGGGVRVEYRGPHTLRGRVNLLASAFSNARLVAITFTLGGRTLGTATRPPWILDVDAALLPPGRAPLTVTAVDRLGGRASSSAVFVRVRSGGERIVNVRSQRGLDALLRALADGTVNVHLGPGIYRANHIVLGSGARLSGSGGATILRAAAPGAALLNIRGRGIRVSDLAIDGDGQIDEGISIGDGSRDVRVQRIGLSRVRAGGVAALGRHTVVSIQDSILLGSGSAAGAGVFDDGSEESSGTSVVRTQVSGFQGYGILFAQRFYGLRTAALGNLALDNRVSDIVDPARRDGTDAGGIWTGGVEASVIGNVIAGAGTDGIETIGSSTGDTIIGNRISSTPVGIYIEHSTNRSLVAENWIANVRNAINVEWRHAGGGSNANTFAGNTIAAAQVGVFVDVQEDYNTIAGNAFTSAGTTPVVFQGSSHNMVRGNRACAASSAFVVQRPGLSQTGSLAQSTNNRLISNERTGPCSTP